MPPLSVPSESPTARQSDDGLYGDHVHALSGSARVFSPRTGLDPVANGQAGRAKDSGDVWYANLDLRFSAREMRQTTSLQTEVPHDAAAVIESKNSDIASMCDIQTVLRHRHVGPLRIQKPLYPEGPACCHAVMIHPPGGIACSDVLTLQVDVAPRAHALIITPAATKWYGAFGQDGCATQEISLNVNGRLEWLPAEAIVFDRARVRSSFDIYLGPQGQLFGWDHLIFGRQGCGEAFSQGCFDQRLRFHIDGKRVWIDRMRLNGADPLFASSIGFDHHNSCATAWMAMPLGQPIEDALIEAARHSHPDVAFTRIHARLLIMRALAPAMVLRQRLEALWCWFRPRCLGRAAQIPRLWAT